MSHDPGLRRGSLLLLLVLVFAGIAFPQAPADAKGRKKIRDPIKAIKEPAEKSAPPAPVTIAEPPSADFLSGEASVAVRGNQNPVIRLGLSPNGVTIIEFPVADRFFALHPGNSDLVTIDESPTKATDHFMVVRAGSGFASPATMAQARKAPVTSIIAQMQSGLVITLLFYPVQQLAEQAHRVVVAYDRNEVISARRAAGLAVNLDGPEEEKPRTASVRISSQAPTTIEPAASRTSPAPPPTKAVADTAYIDTSEPPVKRDRRESSDPVRATRDALAEIADAPECFKRWSDSVHGLSLSVLPVRELDKRSQMILFAVRNTKDRDARIVPGQPEIYLDTLDEKGKPLQIEIVKKIRVQTTATDEMIPGGQTRYYAMVYQAPILGARQRLRVAIGQTIAADEPASASLNSSNR